MEFNVLFKSFFSHWHVCVWGYSSDIIINPFSMTDETKYEITPLWNNPFTYKSPHPTPVVLSVDWTLIFKYFLSFLPCSELFLALDSKKWKVALKLFHMSFAYNSFLSLQISPHQPFLKYLLLLLSNYTCLILFCWY